MIKDVRTEGEGVTPNADKGEGEFSVLRTSARDHVPADKYTTGRSHWPSSVSTIGRA